MKLSRTLVPVVAALLLGLPQVAQAAFIHCRLQYEAEEWSAFYKSVRGTGTVSCDNGQRAQVKLRFQGGGFSVGMANLEGHVRFSEVRELSEVLGTYVTMDGHGGFVRGGTGRILTKGSVWASDGAHGPGFNIGFTFGAMTIER